MNDRAAGYWCLQFAYVLSQITARTQRMIHDSKLTVLTMDFITAATAAARRHSRQAC
jgi:hypothetical protein